MCVNVVCEPQCLLCQRCSSTPLKTQQQALYFNLTLTLQDVKTRCFKLCLCRKLLEIVSFWSNRRLCLAKTTFIYECLDTFSSGN